MRGCLVSASLVMASEPIAVSAQVLEVVVDASNVPGEYALTILSECAAFPRRLVFFLKGQLEVSFAEPPRLS